MFNKELQIEWLLKTQDLFSFLPDSIWYNVTQLASLAGFVLGLSLTYHKGPLFVIYCAVASTITLVLVYQIKDLLDIARPLQIIGSENLKIIGPPLRRLSFPSGHTASIFLLVGIVWQAGLNSTIRWLATGFAIIGGLSRVVVGAHWPQDVIGGALFSLLVFNLVMKILKILTEKVDFLSKINHLSNWNKKTIYRYNLLILILLIIALIAFFGVINTGSNLLLSIVCLIFYSLNFKTNLTTNRP